jgi:hypothetical protein
VLIENAATPAPRAGNSSTLSKSCRRLALNWMMLLLMRQPLHLLTCPCCAAGIATYAMQGDADVYCNIGLDAETSEALVGKSISINKPPCS